MICDTSALTELDPTNSTTTSPNSTISVGVTSHERIGAEYLRKLGFSNKVAQLVESHVPVKRYLTGKDHSYYESLSGASKLSLKYQVKSPSLTFINHTISVCWIFFSYSSGYIYIYNIR